MKRAAIHNLGCKVNSYEAESMKKMLIDAGYTMVDFENDIADVYIINTCSVTNMADRKSRQMLHKAKKMNPDALVVAAGCYVQAAGEELLKDEAVDLIVGNNRKINLVKAIEECEYNRENNTALVEIGKEVEYEPLFIEKDSEHTRAFIKVQDGCNQFCTYCIIPYTRGRIRSRKKEEVLSEVHELTKNGYREIVVTGIHLSSYGKDRNEEDGLIDLIGAICEVEGVDRVRLGSLEPRIVDEAFAKKISALPQICPQFHLSLQSGCDTVLKRMNRKYDTKEYENSCNILRKYFKNPAITTDVIVGFPGETEKEFEITKEYLEKIGFYELHVFKYSRRKGTVADRMPDQIAEDIKSVRSDVLLELDKRMSNEYRDSYEGKMVEVLFEREVMLEEEKVYLGHTREYIEVAVSSNENLVNQIKMVEINGRISDEIRKGTCVIF